MDKHIMYRDLADSITDIFFALDRDMRYSYWNKASETFTGIPASQALGKHILELFPDNELTRQAMQNYRQVLDTGRSTTFINQYLFNDQDWYFEISVYPVVGGISVISKDITLRRRQELELEFHASTLRTILEMSHFQGLSQQDLLSKAVDAACRITGSEFAFVGLLNENEDVMVTHAWSRNAMGICTLQDKPVHFPITPAGIWAECVRQRKPLIINDYSQPHPAKKGFPAGHVQFDRFASAPVFDKDKIVAVAGVANKSRNYSETDMLGLSSLMAEIFHIIKRLHAEDSLRESVVRFRNAIDHFPYSFIILDVDLKISYLNKTVIDTYGGFYAGYIGKEEKEVLPPALYLKSLPILNEALSAGRPVSREFEWEEGSGTRYSRVSYVPVVSSQGVVRELIRTEVDLTEKNETEKRLRALTNQLEKLREEERQRISREIHDELGQYLTALKIDLVNLRNNPVTTGKFPAAVKPVIGLVDACLDSAHRLSFELRPAILDQVGLIPALEWQISEFTRRNKIVCRHDFPENIQGLGTDHAVVVFRIFQELLTNISRHAEATEVQINLHVTAGVLALSVADNGIGFNTELKGESLGLIGMKERAAQYGGTLKIVSFPGAGTSVELQIPLP